MKKYENHKTYRKKQGLTQQLKLSGSIAVCTASAGLVFCNAGVLWDRESRWKEDPSKETYLSRQSMNLKHAQISLVPVVFVALIISK
jgi:hypothetical protein